MAERNIPGAVGSSVYEERPLTAHEVAMGVSALSRQIRAAFQSGRIRTDQVGRIIHVGHLPGQPERLALYPNARHRWSNNRAVVVKLVRALRREGYVIRLVEPQQARRGWTDLSFVVEVPEDVRIVMV